MKLLWLIALVVLAWRLFAGRWPWQSLRSARSRHDRARAQALLGVPPGASREEVIEAHRRHIALVHPDRGGTSELVHEANAARDLLLDDQAPAKSRGA